MTKINITFINELEMDKGIVMSKLRGICLGASLIFSIGCGIQNHSMLQEALNPRNQAELIGVSTKKLSELQDAADLSQSIWGGIFGQSLLEVLVSVGNNKFQVLTINPFYMIFYLDQSF